MTPPQKILLVEDEPLWQEGIRALLALMPETVLVGVAETYDEGLALFHDTQPDVVLMDWKLRGDKDGLMLAKTLEEGGLPPNAIILISGSDPSQIPPHPYGFIPKPSLSSRLLQVLQER